MTDPHLVALVATRKIDAVVCWRLDRFGRNLRHLIVTIEELTAAGVAFVSMGESIDTTSPSGRLMLGILGSFAEFERERIKERIGAGWRELAGREPNSDVAVSASRPATSSRPPA